MKKVLLMIVLMLCFTTSVYAQEFVALKLPIDEYNWRGKVRYADTKEGIPLSMLHGEHLYATVPAENADRPLEMFIPEEITFTDNTAEYESYEFFVMRELAEVGVIKGNEKGEALPYADVTRAEATAMLIRFLGLDLSENYRIPFDDVTKDDWFYNVVATAYKYGIVEGDSDACFSPERNVTREEMTVMTARAISFVGLGYSKEDISDCTDYSEISEWAIEAYNKIGSHGIVDIEWLGEDEALRTLKPKSNASRYDAAVILYNCGRTFQIYPFDIAKQYGFDKEMPVIDGSTSTYPYTTSVYNMLFTNGGYHNSIPAKHSKSHNSYKRLIDGEVDMLFASVYPASDILEYAKQKNVELELIPIAYDAMIFFTNIENEAEGLTKEQISNIYVNDAYENWSEVGGPDALIYPYCRNNDSGSHAQMEKHFLNGSEIHAEVQKETSTTMANVLTDVMSAKTDNPVGYGLGYSIYYYFHNMDMFYDTNSRLKLLAIDGVKPTDETIADGSYPLSNNTFIVLRADTPEHSPARKMAEFMLTEEGQQCVENAGYGRLK